MAVPSEEAPRFERVLAPGESVSVQSLFYRAKNLSISGGTFNFTTTTTALPDFENFRRIPLGDLIVERNLGVVQNLRRHGRNTITLRRVHVAKVFGFTAPFTAAMYEGNNAKEEWDEYISIHTRLSLYAAVFHQGKAILGVAVGRSKDLIRLNSKQCTPWLHRTGLVCFEVAHSDVRYSRFSISGSCEDPHVRQAWSQHSYDTALHSPEYLLPPHEFPNMPSSIDFDDYYRSLSRDLKLPKYRYTTLKNTASVRISSWVIFDGERTGREVAFLIRPEEVFVVCKSCHDDLVFNRESVKDGGWYRFPRTQDGTGIELNEQTLFTMHLHRDSAERADQAWLSQAGYVLSQLGLDFDVCSVVRRIKVKAIIHPSKPSIDEAELFLPPLSAFLALGCTHLQYPTLQTEQPFWFDPISKQPLSGKTAQELGLPEIEIAIRVKSQYLDQSTLKSLREFHRAKGFAPDTQDIAKQLKNPLYYFGNEGDPLPQPLQISKVRSSRQKTPAFYSESDSDIGEVVLALAVFLSQTFA
ncbi:hypothetical protein R3P38DRAFT_2792265 [Favolaschia claudopus]|uniref:Uncharacterized protein n=1 Tax=Favolaschia claudopus TaxID=2862362 RepID=A0AAW0AEU2_9AGAR